jgi:nitrogen fixation protein NifB
MLAARRLSSPFIEQMTHCSRCRADAVGMLGEDKSAEFASCLAACATKPSKKVAARPRVAVASMEGVLVNQHLGVADIHKIYEKSGSDYVLVDERLCPSGGSDNRWEALAAQLSDCRAVLVSAAGEAPRKVLEAAGVAALEMEGLIEDCLEAVYDGGDLTSLKARRNGMGSNCGCGKIREPGTGCG